MGKELKNIGIRHKNRSLYKTKQNTPDMSESNKILWGVRKK